MLSYAGSILGSTVTPVTVIDHGENLFAFPFNSAYRSVHALLQFA